MLKPEKTTIKTEPKQPSNFRSFYAKYVNGLTRILNSMRTESLEELVNDLLWARKHDRQIFIFGNGGSAANASHMANDFSKQRFDDEKLLFRVMSLTDNVSWMTATANDMGYNEIFASQLKNLLRPGDLCIGISSSGKSPNIINAINYANSKGATTWGIVGFDGGEVMTKAKKSIYIPSKTGQYGYMEDVCSIISHVMSVYIYEHDSNAENKTSQIRQSKEETKIRVLDIDL